MSYPRFRDCQICDYDKALRNVACVLKVWGGSWRRVEISEHNGVKFATFVSYFCSSLIRHSPIICTTLEVG